MFIKKTIILLLAIGLLTQSCYAKMIIGSGNNNQAIPNLFKDDFINSCTKQVQRTISNTVRGIGCSLNRSVLNITYELSANGILELQNDKAVAENLGTLAADLKKNTCLHPKTFSNGYINKVKYNYVGPDRITLFSIDVTKSDCAIKSFKNN